MRDDELPSSEFDVESLERFWDSMLNRLKEKLEADPLAPQRTADGECPRTKANPSDSLALCPAAGLHSNVP